MECGMNAVLPHYDLNSTTWFYLSLLLIVAIYFRFTRFWSLRNLDLALLLAFSPALLFIESNRTVSNTWLFAAAGLLLVRLLCDGLFARRPRMEQNLNSPGLAFLGLCALGFLGTRVATEPLPDSTLNTVKRSENLRHRVDASDERAEAGPAPSLIVAPVGAISEAVSPDDSPADHGLKKAAHVTARVMAVLAHVAIVLALFLLGWKLFGDPHAGLAMGLLHLLLPCTFYQASQVIHVLPSALILWAIVCWRKPLVSGGLLGLACGTLFFPLFLLPLWTAFYGRKHALRFLGALSVTGLILVGSLALTSSDISSLLEQILGSINWKGLSFGFEEAHDFWGAQNDVYRLPLGAAFFVGLIVMTIWPRKKSLEYLISASTAIIVATQFWYPQQGGVFMLWYLPLVLVVVFRPRLLHYAPVPPVKAAKSESASPEKGEPPKLVGSALSNRVQFR
jgi:hypothetical protein